MDRNKSRTYKAQANEIRNRLGERDYVLGLDLGVGSIGIAAIALEKIDGVNGVCVDSARGTVEVMYNAPATPQEIKECIENTGHNVE